MGIGGWSISDKLSFWNIGATLVAALIGVAGTLLAVELSKSDPPSEKPSTVYNGSVTNNYFADTRAVNGEPAARNCPPLPTPSGGEDHFVRVYVRLAESAGACWDQTITISATPVRLSYLIQYFNTTTTEAENVAVGSNLAPHVSLIPASTVLFNDSSPDGKLVDNDRIANGGEYIGNYAPGANAYVMFDVESPFQSKLKCGQNTLQTSGSVRRGKEKSKGSVFNTAVVNYRKNC